MMGTSPSSSDASAGMKRAVTVGPSSRSVWGQVNPRRGDKQQQQQQQLQGQDDEEEGRFSDLTNPLHSTDNHDAMERERHNSDALYAMTKEKTHEKFNM